MAFSQESQKKVEDLKAVLDLAQSLKILLNGKTLDSTVKSFYALNDAESEKLQESMDIMAKADVVAVEQKKRKAALDDLHESLAADQEAQQKKFDADVATLNKKKEDNDNTLLAIKAADKALDARETEIEEKSAKADAALKQADALNRQAQSDMGAIEKGKADLAKKWEEVNAYEAGLKATAAQLQKLTGDL